MTWPAQLPLVVLDANILYPFHLRNLLIQFGVNGLIAPRWTQRIHDEWIGNLVLAGRVPRARLQLTLGLMNRVLPDAEIRGWEMHMGGLMLPDPDDRHVVAAALAAGASVILTMNLRDFPPASLHPHGVVAKHPDCFLCTLHDKHPELLRESAEAAYANLSRSAPSFADYLDALHHQGLPMLASRLSR